ncbi:hypothetical protein [Paracoccus sp. PAMC 22219]|uniref:hypothetical protein n=1 Tax=Paracoccus sp. PAMC 22219 TaxID=1569209 RepID=UPI001E441E6D|nr:hypothetical protein [Paracoccus sp. PAMC 22219]
MSPDQFTLPLEDAKMAQGLCSRPHRKRQRPRCNGRAGRRRECHSTCPGSNG